MKSMMKSVALLIVVGLVSACGGSKKVEAPKLTEAEKAANEAMGKAGVAIEEAKDIAGNNPELHQKALEAAAEAKREGAAPR